MSQSGDATTVVLVAGFETVPEAVAAFEEVRSVYGERDADGASKGEAAVIDPRQAELRSRVVRETPRRRQAGGAQAEGLATRLARYLGEGLALVGGAAGGGGQDLPGAAEAGAATGPLDPAELRKLAAVQEDSRAVLIGIFPAAMSADVATATAAAGKRASTRLRAGAEEIAVQIARAENGSTAGPRP